MTKEKKNLQNAMTEGVIWKQLLLFFFPIVLGTFFQQLYNTADAIIVGKFVGKEALAAVGGTTGTLINLLVGFFVGLSSGASVIISQFFGARRPDDVSRAVHTTMALALASGAALTVLGIWSSRAVLVMMGTPEDVLGHAVTYINIYFLGMIPSLIYNIGSGILRAVGDSRRPLFFLISATMTNIVLDVVLVIGLNMGVAGAAIATIAAQAVSGILCLIYIRFRVPLLTLSRADCKADAESIRDLVVMGIPMGLQTSITAIGSMVMQAANNGLGSVYVSGFTAGMRLKQFCMCPFDALGSAVSVFCGQNLGAKKPERIRQGVRLGVIVGVAYGFCIGLVMIFFGRSMSTLFVESSAGDVLDASAKYLRCMGYFFWSLGILNICRMATQGIGFSGRAVFSGVTEMFARSIVSLGFVGAFGYTAICFSDQTAWIAAVLYITPTCLHCIKKVTKQIEAEKANANLSESVG